MQLLEGDALWNGQRATSVRLHPDAVFTKNLRPILSSAEKKNSARKACGWPRNSNQGLEICSPKIPGYRGTS